MAWEVEVRPLTDPELEPLASLAPLIRTPREAKRLANLYRLARSSRDLSPASRFLGEDHRPGEYQGVVVLLARGARGSSIATVARPGRRR